MHKFIAFILFIGVLPCFSLIERADAQQYDTLKSAGVDTRRLDSITVSAAPIRHSLSNKKFSAGTHVIRATEESLAKMQMSSLADYIQQENAVYIKEYGRGMAAFISVRGTSSSHTVISWNGQNFSVPTLGQTDFSHVPLYFFDAMEIHIGGNSALYGNGSIGGSIQLNTKPKWNKGLHGDIILSAGSFNTFFKGATLRYSGDKFESRTSILQSTAKNNYSFKFIP